MPAKLSTIAYVHETTECLTQEFTVKEIMAVSRLSDEDPTKVVYLKIKHSSLWTGRSKPKSKSSIQRCDLFKGKIYCLREVVLCFDLPD